MTHNLVRQFNSLKPEELFLVLMLMVIVALSFVKAKEGFEAGAVQDANKAMKKKIKAVTAGASAATDTMVATQGPDPFSLPIKM